MAQPIDRGHRRIVLAASLGTLFEWYDFYLFGALAAVLAQNFFSALDETLGFIVALLTFAAGFIVRPIGAVLFGRMGDLKGRKHTFLITIVIMGVATTLVGLLPTYESAGLIAPLMLIGLRLLQGLAVGGEYGGAAVYVAEHAPAERRGYYTSWIQITAMAGLVLSLLVILASRWYAGPAFDEWGWRIPFLLSSVLLAISVYIRLRLQESPVFQQMRREGRLTQTPLRDVLGDRRHRHRVLALLFGVMPGAAVVGYVALIYMLLFLTQTLKVDPIVANGLVVAALLLTAPLYVVIGRVADRIGRKPMFVVGCVLSAATLFPIFNGLTYFAHPALITAQANAPVVLLADIQSCSIQFDPVGSRRYESACDIARSTLAAMRVPYRVQAVTSGTSPSIHIGRSRIEVSETQTLQSELSSRLSEAGYASVAERARVNYAAVLGLLSLLALYGVMVYAPLAAWLVELFPAQVRYTALSIPYHAGTGWFAGLLPSIAFALVAYTGDIYAGLWYPVIVCVISAVIGAVLVPETLERTRTTQPNCARTIATS